MTFRDLGLIAPILSALADQGYAKPSPIQAKAIPPALIGRDVLGCAQTGTGKTCAFAAPILQRLNAAPDRRHPIRALILTPTRELAIQIGENFDHYGKNLPLRTAVIFGGVGQVPQVEKLQKGVDILVATPGRLGDLYQQKLLDLSNIEIFVLDEADRMLDMGFIHDVKKILKWLPQNKQTMLFSATMPPEISDLVDSLLKDPARVAVDPVSSPVEAIRQSVYLVDKANKTRLLAQLVRELQVKNALVFTRTKHGANKVARDLGKEGISAAAIHGNKSQTARQQALADFKSGKVQCLVATDIAARGLDIEELSHVFNYNLPEVPETYVHRIGRTGRAGRGGEAIAFCDFSEKPLLKDIEKLIGRPVPVVEEHPFPMQVFEMPKKDKKGRIINEEDAEARAAARELRRQRDEAQKAAAKEKRQAQQVKSDQAAQVLEEAEVSPSKSRRKKKKKAAAQPVQAAPAPVIPAVEPEEAPAPTKKKHRKKGKKPVEPLEQPKPVVFEEPAKVEEPYQVKTSRPKLTRPGTHMETGDAVPRTEFRRPNPLDGDIIMDATARLLAPRRSTLTPQRPVYESEKSAAPKKNRKKSSKEEHVSQPVSAEKAQKEPVIKQESPVSQETAHKKSKKKKKSGKAQTSALKQEVVKQQPVKVATPAPKKEKKNASQPQKDKKRRDRGPRGPVEPMKSGQTKDSTEQKSLMKPFYLSF